MDAVLTVPPPVNEPVRSYAPGSRERVSLEAAVKEMAAADPVDLTQTVDGVRRMGGGERVDVVQPHRRAAVLGRLGNATPDDVTAAITTRRRGAAGSASTRRSDARAASVRAAYSSSSSPPSTYHSRRAGVTANAVPGPSPPSTRAARSMGSVAGT